MILFDLKTQLLFLVKDKYFVCLRRAIENIGLSLRNYLLMLLIRRGCVHFSKILCS